MSVELPFPDRFESRRLRLVTLTRLRWLAVAGQTAAVLIVWLALGYPMPVSLCLALIALSGWLNIFLSLRFPATHRLEPMATFGLLAFDVLQLGGLLYLTGGLSNPFAMLMIVPAVISAASLPLRMTLALSALVVAFVTLLGFEHLPLPWIEGASLAIPPALLAGYYAAILASLAFTVVYAYRVAEEARQLADALAATELVLQREQHLSALDGLAAAAAHELGTPLATIHLVAKELDLAIKADSPHKEDIELIRSQTARCRDILQRLSSLSAAGEAHLATMPLTSLIEEVIGPHRDFGIRLDKRAAFQEGEEPVGKRNPAILHGLGNLVENTVDFAASTVLVEWGWDRDRVMIRITDDGPGFSPDMLDHAGEPYARSRVATPRNGGGGMGLGLFIAKTLLERSGAEINIRNRDGETTGADIRIEWPRSALEREVSPLSAQKPLTKPASHARSA